MALGNSNSSAQSRGKNKAVVVKRRKEVVIAKNYTAILSTAMQGVSACGISLGSNVYYHDGSSSFPVPNDKVYSKQRAGTVFLLPVGNYKMHFDSDRRTSKNIEINPIGVVKKVTACP